MVLGFLLDKFQSDSVVSNPEEIHSKDASEKNENKNFKIPDGNFASRVRRRGRGIDG